MDQVIDFVQKLFYLVEFIIDKVFEIVDRFSKDAE